MKLGAATLILTLALGLLAAPLPAEAEQAGNVYRIGGLAAISPESVPPANREAFLQGLRERGWVEGENVIIEWRYARGRLNRLPTLAAELVRLKVDVIVAVATQPTHAAVNATSTIPIVFTLVGDPVGQGFGASLARPGRNATGLSTLSVDITPKWLELLKETVPEVSRVAVLWNPGSSFGALSVRETEVAARAVGVQLQILEVRGPDDFDSAFAAMTRERAGALLVLPDVLFVLHRRRLADLAAKHRVPAMYGLRRHVDAGGLMAYGANYPALFRRAAHYVDKILKGTKPADLPVEQPTRFELFINMKTARALGLRIPDSVLIRADKLIE